MTCQVCSGEITLEEAVEASLNEIKLELCNSHTMAVLKITETKEN